MPVAVIRYELKVMRADMSLMSIPNSSLNRSMTLSHITMSTKQRLDRKYKEEQYSSPSTKKYPSKREPSLHENLHG
jgi:hypothetical protein